MQTMIKQRKESIALYTQGNRPELAIKDMGVVLTILRDKYADQMDLRKTGPSLKRTLMTQDAVFEQIKARLTLSAFVGKSVPLKKRSHEFVGVLPFSSRINTFFYGQ